MNEDQKEIAQYLFIQYMEGKATELELEQLSDILLLHEDDSSWLEIMEEIFAIEEDIDYKEDEWKSMLQTLLTQNRQKEVRPGQVKRILPLRRFAAAAAILLLLVSSVYVIVNNKTSTSPDQLVNILSPAQDIPAPVSTKARITLADGRTVSVDSLTSGTLVNQVGIRIIKNADGSITYDAPTSLLSSDLAPVFNTLTNPRGSTVIDITLADGSRVWLNAGSSVTYPVAFVGKQRKVSITGEAYFEIAHNKAMPFVVEQNEVSVQVLGTHFNINSYDDEAAIKVTLLEGSVKVKSLRNSQVDNSIIIKPGQQASVVGNVLSIVRDVDIEETMAWKNGLFSFNKVDLRTVLRQLTKWYNVEVEYQGNIPRRTFWGDMERSLSLSQVLKVLEKYEVHFKIDGKKIIVMP